MSKLLFLVTEDWYFRSHRLALAEAAIEAGYEVVLLARSGSDRADIEARGIRVIPLEWERGGFELRRELRAWWEIVRTYRAERPDIVHHVALKPALYGSVARLFGSVPVAVNAIAGLGFVFLSPRWHVRLARGLLIRGFGWLFQRPGARVIVQNPDDRDTVLGWGIASHRMSLIEGVGVDTERFAPAPRSTGSPSLAKASAAVGTAPDRGSRPDAVPAPSRVPAPVVITVVARMLWDKGIGELVQASQSLQAAGLAVKVCLAGSAGDANPASIPAATLRDWTDRAGVEWLGRVDDVAALWQQSDIAVLASYREGLPLSLLEAAACGLPLVATDVPGCRSVVVPEHNGLLVPPRDASALAEALEVLVRDEQKRRAFGANSRALACSRFAKARINAETLALYRVALGETG